MPPDKQRGGRCEQAKRCGFGDADSPKPTAAIAAVRLPAPSGEPTACQLVASAQIGNIDKAIVVEVAARPEALGLPTAARSLGRSRPPDRRGSRRRR